MTSTLEHFALTYSIRHQKSKRVFAGINFSWVQKAIVKRGENATKFKMAVHIDGNIYTELVHETRKEKLNNAENSFSPFTFVFLEKFDDVCKFIMLSCNAIHNCNKYKWVLITFGLINFNIS